MNESAEPVAVPNIVLPPVLDAAAAAGLKPEFEAALAVANVQVDAAAVQRATTQGLQLLAAAAQSFASAGAKFGFVTASAPLREASQALGLAPLLRLEGE